MIKYIEIKHDDSQQYPWNVPAISKVKRLDLSNPITIFVGDNGSGKSTLLKAIAYANQSINVSNHRIDSGYYGAIQKLAKKMTCTYDYKSRKGFFFSGEEFISYINHINEMKEDLKREINRVDEAYKDKSEFARLQARGAFAGQLHQLNHTYDGDLKERSHGEGFLSFFKARMHQKGIYILDEPETPLSAVNQYQLVVLITDLVAQGSQVIIATHSPIIMALKDAYIYEFSKEGVHHIQYDDIEHVNFLRNFINHKDQFIDRLTDK